MYESLHIHKNLLKNNFLVLFLFIPSIIFVVVLTYFVFLRAERYRVSQSVNQQEVLGEDYLK